MLIFGKAECLQFCAVARQNKKMESVSSCSPTTAASTSSAPASATALSSRPKQTVAVPQGSGGHPPIPLKTARGTLTSDPMPHPRDERRDDTVLFPHVAEKPRWNRLVSETSTLPPMASQYQDHQNPHGMAYRYQQNAKGPPPWLQHQPPHHWYTHGDLVVFSREGSIARRLSGGAIGTPNEFSRSHLPTQHSSRFFPQTTAYSTYKPRPDYKQEEQQHSISRYVRDSRNYRSTVVIPHNISIPKDLSPTSQDTSSPAEDSLGKRSSDTSNRSETPPATKRSRNNQLHGGFDKLDLLCSATLELGPLQENPSGCSCPKSKCIALYCDCFKAGRRCDPSTCSCLNCKNTIEESGVSGARSKVRIICFYLHCVGTGLTANIESHSHLQAIQSILARNPRAFTNAGNASAPNKLPSGEQACNCIRSRCLKLYCTCFQQRKPCTPGICTCVGCLNEEGSVERAKAIEMTLDKRPDAFKQKSKVKILGAG